MTRKLFVNLFFLVLATSLLHAQQITGQTNGRVVDETDIQVASNLGATLATVSDTDSFESQPVTAVERSERFEVVEATIAQIQEALESGSLTSEELVQLYLDRIEAYQPLLNAYLHVNENALKQAHQLDVERKKGKIRGPLHGIPVLVKDNMNTADMPTTGGALAFAGSFAPDDAFLVQKLQEAGAILMGKSVLTELANWVSGGAPGTRPPSLMPANYSALGEFSFNPYDPRPFEPPLCDPETNPDCDGRPVLATGTSSSGIAAAASLVTVYVGTETSGSILSPSIQNMLVGIKPTVGLISRSGIIPITADQDIAGPLARTVADAAILLGILAGFDPNDPATEACKVEGNCHSDYTPFLDPKGLQGARIGVPRDFFWDTLTADQRKIAENAIALMQKLGATIIDPADMPSARQFPAICSGQLPAEPPDCSTVLKYGFKRDFNAYLATRPDLPVSTLAELIRFNMRHEAEGAIRYGQRRLLTSEAVDLEKDQARYLADRENDLRLSRDEGIDAVLKEHNLDAIFFPGIGGTDIGARAGYPTIVVPAGFLPPVPPVEEPIPYGISFTGTAFSEPTLIRLAFAFEQATGARRPPASTPPLPK